MTELLNESKVPISMELFVNFINNKSGDKYEKRKCRKKILQKEHDYPNGSLYSIRHFYFAHYASFC